ncbi:MAG: hypothetical protein AB1679_24365 [Actinomycetota bacterium]
MTLTRRQVRILLAAAVWTLYVWISRIVIMAGGDESTGFKVVHGLLAFVSIGFALAIGKIGLDARRRLKGPTGPPERARAVAGSTTLRSN